MAPRLRKRRTRDGSPRGHDLLCQRTAIEGLEGIGKTQIAWEAVYRARRIEPDCSVFWVLAINAVTFENSYREIGQALRVEGINETNSDVKSLVKAELSRENINQWLLVIDNADDVELFFGGQTPLSYYLPFSRKGSILLTTRNHQTAFKFTNHIITIMEMSKAEALDTLQNNLGETQVQDEESTEQLLGVLTYLPPATKQASAYMAAQQLSISKYIKRYESETCVTRMGTYSVPEGLGHPIFCK
ncbi:hypothetical protein F4803DRAFT_557012 [Xylaria telfairii]|nr:hypothetical protein F4803DRAFT_557012 [Xylaria telfairii]